MNNNKNISQLVDLNIIRNYIGKSSRPDFIKKRQLLMIEFLAITGARLSYLEHIKTDSFISSPHHSSQIIIKIQTGNYPGGSNIKTTLIPLPVAKVVDEISNRFLGR